MLMSYSICSILNIRKLFFFGLILYWLLFGGVLVWRENNYGIDCLKCWDIFIFFIIYKMYDVLGKRLFVLIVIVFFFVINIDYLV